MESYENSQDFYRPSTEGDGDGAYANSIASNCIEQSLEEVKEIQEEVKEIREEVKENIEKLNQELMDVNKIMTESFDMLLNRDKNLNQIVHDSANLRNDSKDLRKKSKNLKMAFWFRKYMTPIIICSVIFVLIALKLYLF